MTIYSQNSRHSFFIDRAVVTMNEEQQTRDKHGYAESRERLEEHGREVRNTLLGNGDRSYCLQVRESVRSTDVKGAQENEKRALSTTAASGGSFVTPQYLIDLWAKYRSPNASFWNESNLHPLPPYGMEIYLPGVSSTSSISTQSTENTGTAESTPSGEYVASVAVNTFAGAVPISQQLLDRAGYDGQGGSFDQIVIGQMASQLQAQLSIYALTQAIATTANTTTNNSSLTTTLFWQNVVQARRSLEDSQGTRLQGTHMFTTNDVSSWAFYQVDSEGRPIFVADSGALTSLPPVGSPVASGGWTGLHFGGNLAWYEDDNIPTSSGNSQVVVAHMPESYAWWGTPISYCYVQSNAQELSVLVGLRQYAAYAMRYPNGVAVVSGSAYSGLS